MEIKNYIWYERYRAHNLKDMILPDNYVETFQSYIKNKEIPHLLFHGPQGSGKTTLAFILLIRCSSNQLILNASSSDRGISTIKTKVKQFASIKRTGKKLNVVLLDEADGLTPDAQQALRNTMETYSDNCRFILTANSIGRIISPIFSRCTEFSFNSLPINEVEKRMKQILETEDIKFKMKQVSKLIKQYYPDIRTIINNLQACSVTGKFTPSDSISVRELNEITTLIKKGKVKSIRELWAGQTNFEWFYKNLFDEFVPTIEDSEKQMEVALSIADYLYKDRTVADREINATACCIEIMDHLKVRVNFNA